MPKTDNLTPKEIQFIKGIVAGKPKYKAMLDAYDVKTPETASVMASETLKKPRVQEALQKALAAKGITVEKIVQPVVDALNATVRVKTQDNEVIDSGIPDLEMQLRGHDRAMKIIVDKPENDDSSGNTFIQINQHITEQKDKYGL